MNVKRLIPLVTVAALFGVLALPVAAQASTPVFGLERFANYFAEPPFSESWFPEPPLAADLAEFFDEGGKAVTLAGSHPYAMSTEIVFDHVVEEEEVIDPGGKPEETIPTKVGVGGDPREIETVLPAGVVGDPLATPERCTEAELQTTNGVTGETGCPASSAVGLLAAYTTEFPNRIPGALYNMVAPVGVPAQFGANLVGLGFVIHIDAKVRPDSELPGGYAVAADATNILHSHRIYAVAATLWGDPSAASHDSQRGFCGGKLPSAKAEGQGVSCPAEPSKVSETPFLSMPASCTSAPLSSSVAVESWQQAGVIFSGTSTVPAVSGCGALRFEPKLEEAKPETQGADSATGLQLDLHLPQAPPEDRPGASVVCSPGSWQNDPTAFAYRWLLDGAPIAGATSSTYVVAEGDTGALLQCEVIASGAGVGPGFATSAPLPATTPLTLATPTTSVTAEENGKPVIKNGKPVITHTVPATGGTVNCEPGAWGGSPAFAYQWFKDGSPLAGQTAGSYVVAAGETPLTLQCEVIATDASGTVLAFSAEVESEPALAPALPSFTAAPRASFPESDLPLATPELKNAVVTMPAGMTLNPSAADGLEGCKDTPEPAFGVEPERPGGEIELGTALIVTCPNSSKIGNVEVTTPVLEKPLPGSLYLAQPHENPFGSLLALYLVVNDEERGILVKLAGHVEVGGEPGGGSGLAPGQIRATFENSPQLPVEDVKFSSKLPEAHDEGLFGGARASLTTPPTCGSYAATSVFTPWSAPETGPPATPSSPPFEITAGAGGGACPKTQAEEPNDPGFTAGTFTPVAGTYSPFVFTLSRVDGSQALRAGDATLPPGLLGKLAGVQQCPQADIEQAEHRNGEGEGKVESEHPSCPAASEVGTATVGVGSGAPFYVKTAHVYLAGPYKGGPFSLVFIAPAIAGPFDLGTVVVRGGLYINPETAQVTFKSDPLPSSLDGVPLEIRSITGEATRKQFILNPTSCAKLQVAGTIFGESSPTSLSQAPVSSPFQVGGCTGLPFKPVLSASAGGHGSKAGGTNLNIAVTSAGVGQANIAKLHIQFPMQLSSRLTTLQKACTEAQFNANPALCDPDSVIGHAIVHTPLLSGPLTGPAYLVSHGGAAFPDVEFVLQGEGVEVVVDAKTDIKNGITYSYLESVPDAPFTSFETELPAGPDSVFTPNVSEQENYSLCAQTLTMPIEMTGQNGAKLAQNIKIAPTGCPNALRVISKKLGPARKTLTLSVEVPAAGKLTASGKGLKVTSKTSTARQIVSLSVSLAKADAAKIARHKSVKVKVNLAFAPSSGKKLTSSFAATYKAKTAKKGAHKKK